MRILYVINGFDPGGAEHGLLTLIRGGFFAGHELSVLGFCHGRGQLAEEIDASLPPRSLTLATREAGLSVAGIARGTAALLAAIRRERPDAVVLSLKQANVVGRLVLTLFPRIRCISFEHIARYRARRMEGLYGGLLRLLSFRVDEVWADCAETLNETQRYFLGRPKAGHAVPLFEVEADVPAKQSYALSGPLRVVGAGRLVGRKNFDRLVAAISALAAGRSVQLDIFGDGPERDALQALIDRVGADAIRLHGYAPRWHAQEAVVGADVFVNLSDTEGFCITVAEAMAVGLPVIATDVGGIREYGVDGANMIKLALPDEAEVVAALRRLAADEPLRRRIGERGRADMLAAYGPDALRRAGRDILSTRRTHPRG